MFVFLGSESLQAAEVFLGITKTESEKIPFGILRFEADQELRSETQLAREVLQADLRRSPNFSCH